MHVHSVQFKQLTCTHKTILQFIQSLLALTLTRMLMYESYAMFLPLVLINSDDIAVTTWSSGTVSRSQGGGTLLEVPRPVPALSGRADGQREDRVCVAVAVAVVSVPAAVAGCPDEDAALAVPASHNSVQECSLRQRSRSVN